MGECFATAQCLQQEIPLWISVLSDACQLWQYGMLVEFQRFLSNVPASVSVTIAKVLGGLFSGSSGVHFCQANEGYDGDIKSHMSLWDGHENSLPLGGRSQWSACSSGLGG